MDILQYFESEYKSLQDNIDATTNTLLETKQIVLDFTSLEKELLHLILTFRFNTKDIHKSLEIIERVTSTAIKFLNSSITLQQTIQKTMSY